jgi:hypothetical protein
MSARLPGRVLLSVFLAAVSSFAQQPSPRPRIENAVPRERVRDDALVNPSSSRPHPDLPARARTDRGRAEPGERKELWAAAQWMTSTLQLPANARKTITVASSSILLVRASWPDQSDLTVSVTRGNTIFKSVKGVSTPGVGRIATARVQVPSSGNVGIAIAGVGAPKVKLQVGVLPVR